MTAPCSWVSTARIRSVAAGTVPVTPATMVGSAGGLRLQALGLPQHQAFAPGGRRHLAHLLQVQGPVLRHDLEEVEGQLPMRGKVVGHEGVEPGQADLLHFHHVHQAR